MPNPQPAFAGRYVHAADLGYHFRPDLTTYAVEVWEKDGKIREFERKGSAFKPLIWVDDAAGVM